MVCVTSSYRNYVIEIPFWELQSAISLMNFFFLLLLFLPLWDADAMT